MERSPSRPHSASPERTSIDCCYALLGYEEGFRHGKTELLVFIECSAKALQALGTSISEMLHGIFYKMGVILNHRKIIILDSQLTVEFGPSVKLQLPITREWKKHLNAYCIAGNVMLWVAENLPKNGHMYEVKLSDDMTQVHICNGLLSGETRMPVVDFSNCLPPGDRLVVLSNNGGLAALASLFDRLDQTFTRDDTVLPEKLCNLLQVRDRDNSRHGFSNLPAYYDGTAKLWLQSTSKIDEASLPAYLAKLLKDIAAHVKEAIGCMGAFAFLKPEKVSYKNLYQHGRDPAVYFIGAFLRLMVWCRCRRLDKNSTCTHKPVALWIAHLGHAPLSSNCIAAIVLVAELVAECTSHDHRMIVNNDGTVRWRYFNGHNADEKTGHIPICSEEQLSARQWAERYFVAIQNFHDSLPQLTPPPAPAKPKWYRKTLMQLKKRLYRRRSPL